jgi:FtsH-binding integral membrane protein
MGGSRTITSSPVTQRERLPRTVVAIMVVIDALAVVGLIAGVRYLRVPLFSLGAPYVLVVGFGFAVTHWFGRGPMGRSGRGSYTWLMLWVFCIGCCLFLLIASAAFRVATRAALAIGPPGRHRGHLGGRSTEQVTASMRGGRVSPP